MELIFCSWKENVYFQEKLKVLKASLKVWNLETFGNLDLEFFDVINDLNDLNHLVAFIDHVIADKRMNA